jgi:hypothetical protein
MPSRNTKSPKLTFRFLDLPPELRNQTYAELLTIRPTIVNSTKIASTPRLLCASKKCRDEGEYIQQKVNKVETNVTALCVFDTLTEHML